MASPPSSPKQWTILDLLTPLVGVLVLTGMYLWYMNRVENVPLPAELKAADTALNAGQSDQARAQFEKLLMQAPDSPEHYKLVMIECSGRNRWDMALEYGERALDACKYASNSTRAELYLQVALCYSEGGEKPPQPNAQQYARRAAELDPDNPDILNGLGYILADNARTEQEAIIALGYINRALKQAREMAVLPPGHLAQIEDSYGWALYKRGTFDTKFYTAAADAINQAVDDLPSGVTAAYKVLYYHLGAACRAAGRNEEARHALEIALHYDPKYAAALREFQALPPVTPLTAAPATTSAMPATAAPPIASAPRPVTVTPEGKTIFKPLLDPKPTK